MSAAARNNTYTMIGNNTSISERLRITGGGTVKINPAELQTTAGDKFAQIRGGGIINTTRHATGQYVNTAPYSPQVYGYIGQSLRPRFLLYYRRMKS